MLAALCIWSLQGLVIMVDEFIFHHRRTLPRWERLGHPLDTFCLLLCFDYCLLVPYHQELQLDLFILLALVSCLVISKDEWVHSEHCSPTEHWLHALLFILHPLCLVALYWLWQQGQTLPIILQSCAITLFMFYQIIYWNLYQRKGHEAIDQ